MLETLTITQMRAAYPDEWILVGDPILNEPEIEASIISQLLQGVVLYHSKDKKEIAYKAQDIKKKYSTTTLIFTGEIPKGRKFWL